MILGFTKISESNEEKRARCLQLLEFCAEHPQLRNNKIFTDFFSDVETPKSEADADESTPDAAASPASDVIHLLSKEGNILQAAAVSTELVRGFVLFSRFADFFPKKILVAQAANILSSFQRSWGLSHKS